MSDEPMLTDDHVERLVERAHQIARIVDEDAPRLLHSDVRCVIAAVLELGLGPEFERPFHVARQSHDHT